MRIGKIASSAEYQMDKRFQNLFFFFNFDNYQNLKKSGNLLIFQFRKFLKFSIHKIPKISNL